jgi:hypothetical protein
MEMDLVLVLLISKEQTVATVYLNTLEIYVAQYVHVKEVVVLMEEQIMEVVCAMLTFREVIVAIVLVDYLEIIVI